MYEAVDEIVTYDDPIGLMPGRQRHHQHRPRPDPPVELHLAGQGSPLSQIWRLWGAKPAEPGSGVG
jgi:hypothetical protein